MQTTWYYTQDSHRLGPFSWDQLRQLASAGLLLPTAMVREEGEAGLSAAAAVAGLFPKREVLDSSVQPPATSPACKAQNGDGPVRNSGQSGAASAELVWFYARNKQRLGPYTWMQLCQLAEVNILKRDDMVRRQTEQCWVVAASVPGLFGLAEGNIRSDSFSSVPRPVPLHLQTAALSRVVGIAGPVNGEPPVAPNDGQAVVIRAPSPGEGGHGIAELDVLASLGAVVGLVCWLLSGSGFLAVAGLLWVLFAIRVLYKGAVPDLIGRMHRGRGVRGGAAFIGLLGLAMVIGTFIEMSKPKDNLGPEMEANTKQDSPHVIGMFRPKYNLGQHRATPGLVIHEKFSFVIPDASLIYRPQGNGDAVSVTSNHQTARVIRILNAQAGRSSRLTITHPVDITTTTFHTPGQPDSPEDELGSLQGRTVVWQSAAGAWTKTLEGAPPTSVQRKAMEQEADFANGYPDQEIDLGHTWRIEGSALQRYLGNRDRRAVGGQIDFSFDKIEDFHGEKWALVSMSGSANWKERDDDERDYDVEIRLSGVILRSLTTLTDVSSELHGDIRVKGCGVVDGQLISYETAGPISVSGQVLADIGALP